MTPSIDSPTPETATPAAASPASPKPGAPQGNRNRQRIGKRARQSLVLGTPRPGTAYAVAGAREVMREIEAAVMQARGEVTLFDSSVILEIGEHEVSRRLCWRLLRLEADKLSTDQQIELRKDASKAASERNRCLKLLGLDKRKASADPWAALHASQAAALLAPTAPMPKADAP